METPQHNNWETDRHRNPKEAEKVKKEFFRTFKKFYEENKDNVNVVVVFTRRKTNLSETKKYAEESKFTFPVYYDADDSIMKGFKVNSIPYNIKIENSTIENLLGGTMKYDNIKSAFYLK